MTWPKNEIFGCRREFLVKNGLIDRVKSTLNIVPMSPRCQSIIVNEYIIFVTLTYHKEDASYIITTVQSRTGDCMRV